MQTFSQMAHKEHGISHTFNATDDHSDAADHHHHDHHHAVQPTSSPIDPHLRNLFYGLVSLLGIVGFLIIERAMTIVSDLCHNSRRKTSKVRCFPCEFPLLFAAFPDSLS
jgi:hypothetical protein